MFASKKGKQNVFDTLRHDDLVANYEKYAPKISEALAPVERDATILGQLVQLGAFPVIAHVGGGTTVVLHHLTDTAVNSITGATKNATGIAGIHGTGTPVEFKGFKRKTWVPERN